MSRWGAWQPTTVEGRLDRIESLAEIHQLPARYALALDGRDMDALVELFIPDVRVGADHQGRAALRAWFADVMSVPRTSVHLVSNHVVDFEGPDRATGVVYCHDELERPATGKWETGRLIYRDTYTRVDGHWYFARRRFQRWYLVDALERPAPGAGVNVAGEPLRTDHLPDAFDTWAGFWDEATDRLGRSDA